MQRNFELPPDAWERVIEPHFGHHERRPLAPGQSLVQPHRERVSDVRADEHLELPRDAHSGQRIQHCTPQPASALSRKDRQNLGPPWNLRDLQIGEDPTRENRGRCRVGHQGSHRRSRMSHRCLAIAVGRLPPAVAGNGQQILPVLQPSEVVDDSANVRKGAREARQLPPCCRRGRDFSL